MPKPRRGALQGIAGGTQFDYTEPALSTKDLTRDKLVSYSATKIYNNRPKTFDLSVPQEGYTLEKPAKVESDMLPLVSAWTNSTTANNSEQNIKLKAVRVRIPIIHDGFLPDPLDQEEVNKFGSEAIIKMHPIAYYDVTGETGWFGISSEPAPLTRAKIIIHDKNLTKFEVISFLEPLAAAFPTRTNAVENYGDYGPPTPLSNPNSNGRVASDKKGPCSNDGKFDKGEGIQEFGGSVTEQKLFDDLNARLQDPNLVLAMIANAKGESGLRFGVAGDCENSKNQAKKGIRIQGKCKCCSFGLWQFNICGGLGIEFLDWAKTTKGRALTSDEEKLDVLSDYPLQIEFMVHYLQTRWGKTIRSGLSTEEFVDWFVAKVERPADIPGAQSKRRSILAQITPRIRTNST